MLDLVFVSAGLGLEGGGRALAGRLLATSCAGFARERGITLTVLGLTAVGAVPELGTGRDFAGRQGALARDVWRRQILGRKAAYVFDLLGLARTQAWLPAPLRAPYLVPLYGIEVWQRLTGDRARALAGATCRLAISAYTAARARQMNPGLAPFDIDLLPLCLEERPPAGRVDSDVLARAGEGFVLIVGRMAAGERYKGHDELLSVLPDLLAGRPGLRVVVAGDGDDRPRLERRARALGLPPDAVQFTGFASEATLAELYRRAAVFAMPSRGEGFGLVYLEAMRAGKPCVAARDSAAAEVVVDGTTGLLVDPADPATLRDALARLLDEPQLAGRLGAAGRERYLSVFTHERFDARLWPHLDHLTA
jgi:phosphatidylinositol alpha-1,6-mannosyltransferase